MRTQEDEWLEVSEGAETTHDAWPNSDSLAISDTCVRLGVVGCSDFRPLILLCSQDDRQAKRQH